MKDFFSALLGVVVLLLVVFLAVKWRMYACQGADHYVTCMLVR